MNEIECALVGKLVTDVTLREGKSGKTWAGFSVVVGDGDNKQFAQIAAFGDAVASVTPLSKGAAVYVEGKIKLNEWTTAEGVKRAGLSVSTFKAVPLGQIGKRRPRKSDDGSDDGEPSTRSRNAAMRDYAKPRSTDARAAGPISCGPQFDQSIPF